MICKCYFEKRKLIKGEPKVHYILKKYKKKGSYDILIDMSENFTLVQLIDYLGNVNHAISVVGYWILDSKYKRAFALNIELLDMICDPTVGEEQVAVFLTVLTEERHIFLDACLKKY